MAIPALLAFAPRIRRLYPIIRAGVSRGLSSRVINAVIKKAEGTGIKRQVLLDVMRVIGGVQQQGKHLRNLGRNAIPNIKRLPEAITKLRTAVSFTVRVLGIAVETGEEVERWVTVGLDKPVSRSVIEEMARQRIEGRREKYEIEFLVAQLREGVKAGPLGRL